MKRLHLLVIKSFVGPFILIFFIVLFVLLMQFLWKYIDDLVGKGLEFPVIAELLLYTTASLVPLAFPLAVLMSSLMTFGNMGEYNELTAIKASGISLGVVMRPMIILILLLTIGSFFFANEVLPYTNLKMRALLYDVRRQEKSFTLDEGTFYNGIDGYSIRIEKKVKIPGTKKYKLYGIRVYDHSENKGNTSVTIAESGEYRKIGKDRFMELTLYNGCTYSEVKEEKRRRSKQTYPHRLDSFGKQVLLIELTGFGLTRTDEKLFRNHYAMLDLNELKKMENSVKDNLSEGRLGMVKNIMTAQYFKKRLPTKSQKAADTLANRSIDELPETKNDLRDQEKQEVIPDQSAAKHIVPQQQTRTLNQDPEIYSGLFDQLTLREKKDVLTSALSYVRSTRTYIVTSSNSRDVKIRNLRKYEIEWHRKFTLAFACFLFLLIGAPLGGIIRKGGLGIPLILSVLLFLFYYILSLAGEKIVRESILPAWQGMWATSFIFLVTGIFLSYKASRDAAMLSLETYTNFVKKHLGIRRIVLMDKIEIQTVSEGPKKLKHDKLLAALASFRETILENIDSLTSRLKLSGFLVSLAGFRESTNIILFERLYKNIISSICNSDLKSDKAIMNKLYEFPNFKHGYYLDLRWRLYLRLILLLIPPITILIMIRHYIQLAALRARLKFISQLTTDLIILLQKHDILDS